MTIFARTLDRRPPARATALIPGLVAILFTAFLWPCAAPADLDDVRRAAEAGEAGAQLELGILYQYGFKYKDNEIHALAWYTLSANQGNAKAAKLRDTLKANLTEKQVQEAMEQVAQFKPSGKPVAAPAPVAPDTVPAPETPVEPAPPEAGTKPAGIETPPVSPPVQ